MPLPAAPSRLETAADQGPRRLPPAPVPAELSQLATLRPARSAERATERVTSTTDRVLAALERTSPLRALPPELPNGFSASAAPAMPPPARPLSKAPAIIAQRTDPLPPPLPPRLPRVERAPPPPQRSAAASAVAPRERDRAKLPALRRRPTTGRWVATGAAAAFVLGVFAAPALRSVGICPPTETVCRVAFLGDLASSTVLPGPAPATDPAAGTPAVPSPARATPAPLPSLREALVAGPVSPAGIPSEGLTLPQLIVKAETSWSGQGAPADPAEAAYWLRQVVMTGPTPQHRAALNRLAKLYVVDGGLEHNPVLAGLLFEIAAAEGSLEATCNLATLRRVEADDRGLRASSATGSARGAPARCGGDVQAALDGDRKSP